MSIFALIDARIYQRGGTSEADYLDIVEKRMGRRAPHPLHASPPVPLDAEEAPSDREIIRREKGKEYTDSIERDLTAAHEDFSRHGMEIRDNTEMLKANSEEHDAFIENTPDDSLVKLEAWVCASGFLIIWLADFTTLLNSFSDLLGVKSVNLRVQFLTNYMASLSVATSLAFFFVSLFLAHLGLKAKNKVKGFLPLLLSSLLIGVVRAYQTVAAHGVDKGVILMSLVFFILSASLPILGAIFFEKLWESLKTICQARGKVKSFKRVEGRIEERLEKARNEHRDAKRRLEKLVRECSAFFEENRKKKIASERETEAFRRERQYRLANAKAAYRFWEMRSSRKAEAPKLSRNLPRLTVLLLLITPLLLVNGCSPGNQPVEKFNMLLLCDRSYSTGGLSCTPEKIREAADAWVRKADESGEGGRFQLALISQGFDSPLLFEQDFPSRFPGPVSLNRQKWKEGFLQRLDSLKLPEGTGSAVAEAISRNSLRIREDGRTVMVVMSDLKEVNSRYNFEERMPPDAEFIKYLDENDIRPRFRPNTQITVCGLLPDAPGSRTTAKSYNRLLSLWQALFSKWSVKAGFSESCGFGEE